MVACTGSRIVIGTAIVADLTFRDPDQTLVDPTTITVTLRKPDGTTATYLESAPEITQISTGLWRFVSPIVDSAGRWWIRVAGQGNGADAAAERWIDVSGSQI